MSESKPPPIDPRNLYGVTRAAKYMDLPTTRVYQLERQGRLKPAPGYKHRFLESEMARCLAELKSSGRGFATINARRAQARKEGDDMGRKAAKPKTEGGAGTIQPLPGSGVPAKVETPKPETPKPETPKPETPKPETPKPEATKPLTWFSGLIGPGPLDWSE